MIRFYKDGDNMGIQTDATSYEEFHNQFAAALANMVEGKRYEGDWEFQLSYWIPQAIEIACKLKGYKSDVEEKRVIYSGGGFTNDANLVSRYPEAK